MATITASAAGGNWSATATWTGGVVPGSGDDVVLASTSGSVTIDVTASCRSLDCQASGQYAGTLLNSGFAVGIGDATAGAGNIALRFSSAMTSNMAAGSGNFVFNSTSATQQTIDVLGKGMRAGTINSGSYKLASAWGLTGTTAFILNGGSLDTGNFTMSLAGMTIAGATAKSLTLGTSAITCSGNWTYSGSNLTLSALSSTINMTSATASFTSGGSAYGTVNMNTNGAASLIGSTHSFVNFSRATTGTVDSLNVTGGAAITVTGTLTFTGSNQATSRQQVTSSVAGTPATFTCSGTLVVQNVDFMDIVGAGTAFLTMPRVGQQNQVTDPSFEASITGWSNFASGGGTGGTPTRVADATMGSSFVGEFPVTGITGSGVQVVFVATGAHASNPTLTAGHRYGFRAAVKIQATDGTIASVILRARCLLNAGTYVGAINLTAAPTAQQNTPVTGTVYQLAGYIDASTIIASFPTTQIVALEVDVSFTSGTTITTRVDRMMVTDMGTGSMSTVPPYTDGSSLGYGWTGTAQDSASVFTGLSLGDAGGNSGIALTAAQTLYKIGAGTWAAGTNWSLTSGGSAAGVAPLPQDVAIFDSSTTVGTISVPGRLICKDLTTTGWAGTLNFITTGVSVTGSVTIGATTVLTGTASVSFKGRGSHTITSSGVQFPTTLTFTAPGATYTLQDDLSTVGGIALNNGSFIANNKNVTAINLSSAVTTTRSLDMGAGTWTFTGTGTIIALGTTTGLTFSGALCTMVVADTSATTKTIGILGLTVGPLVASAGTYIVSFANSSANYASWNIGAGVTFRLGGTTTVRGPITSGAGAAIVSSTAGTARNLTFTSPQTVTGLTVQDITVNAINNLTVNDGVNAGNNTNVIFQQLGAAVLSLGVDVAAGAMNLLSAAASLSAATNVAVGGSLQISGGSALSMSTDVSSTSRVDRIVAAALSMSSGIAVLGSREQRSAASLSLTTTLSALSRAERLAAAALAAALTLTGATVVLSPKYAATTTSIRTLDVSGTISSTSPDTL